MDIIALDQRLLCLVFVNRHCGKVSDFGELGAGRSTLQVCTHMHTYLNAYKSLMTL